MAFRNSNTSLNKNIKLDNIIANKFNELTKENQKIIVTQYAENKSKGIFDKIFGTKKVEIYISLIISILLFIIGCIVMLIEFWGNGTTNYEIWERIFPIITLIIGYMFGKNPEK